jgi:cobalt-zinc-cadmium efflux system outer membrane protein
VRIGGTAVKTWIVLFVAALLACPVASNLHSQEPTRATLGSPRADISAANAFPIVHQHKPESLKAPTLVRQPTLTLSQIEAQAIAMNPTIAAAQAQVDQELGLYRQAGLYPNPSLGYVRSDPSQAGQSTTQGIFYSQEVVVGNKLQLNRAIENQEVQLKIWQLEAQRERVRNDVRIQFYETLGAQRMVEAAIELERLAQEGVDVIKQAEKAKVAIRPDVLRAELQLQSIRLVLKDARDRQQTAWRQLATVAGQPDLQPVALHGELDSDLARLTWEESLQTLLSGSPLLRAQEAKIEAARFSFQRARVEPLPNPTVQLVAERDQTLNFNSISTFVAIPVPVFNRNQGNIQAAAALIRQEESEYERIRLALQDQLAGSFRQYLTSRNHAIHLKDEILPRAKENLDLTLQAQKAGQVSFSRVLDARQMYFENKLAHIEALTELHKNTIEITGLLLTGGLNPTEVGIALQTRGAAARGVLAGQLQEQGAARNRLLPGALQAGGGER